MTRVDGHEIVDHTFRKVLVANRGEIAIPAFRAAFELGAQTVAVFPPTLSSTEPSTDPDTLVAATSQLTFPVFVKAVAGGEGRGMRRVDAGARPGRGGGGLYARGQGGVWRPDRIRRAGGG